jgi:hypothetical protein
MRMRMRLLCLFTAVVLVCAAFVFGFSASVQLKRVTPDEVRRGYLLEAGDAPAPVRAGVLAAMKRLQDGYVRRDPEAIDAFMDSLFLKSDDVLLMGTDTGEWMRGYAAVGRFIRDDWRYWGDLRLAVDTAVISSSGDVAWVATTGMCRARAWSRPVRFTSILKRTGGQWFFRQLHFQWDERDPSFADLRRPGVVLRLAGLAWQGVTKLFLWLPARFHQSGG